MQEGFSKLRLHLDDEVPCFFQVLLPGDLCSVDHVSDALLVQGEEHITEPVLVEVHPVPLIREVLKQLRIVASKFQEVS